MRVAHLVIGCIAQKHRSMKYKIKETKPRLRVRAFSDGWSFSYNGEHIGAMWYNGMVGGICQAVLNINPHLK